MDADYLKVREHIQDDEIMEELRRLIVERGYK